MNKEKQSESDTIESLQIDRNEWKLECSITKDILKTKQSRIDQLESEVKRRDIALEWLSKNCYALSPSFEGDGLYAVEYDGICDNIDRTAFKGETPLEAIESAMAALSNGREEA